MKEIKYRLIVKQKQITLTFKHYSMLYLEFSHVYAATSNEISILKHGNISTGTLSTKFFVKFFSSRRFVDYSKPNESVC